MSVAITEKRILKPDPDAAARSLAAQILALDRAGLLALAALLAKELAVAKPKAVGRAKAKRR